MSDERKAIHLNLHGTQIEDYRFARQTTGITNDNDLLRHLLRQFRLDRQKPANVLVDTPSSYHTEPVPEEA